MVPDIEIIGTSAMEVLSRHSDTVRHIMEFVPYEHLADLMQAALVEGLKVLDGIAEMEERRYCEQFDPDGHDE